MFKEEVTVKLVSDSIDKDSNFSFFSTALLPATFASSVRTFADVAMLYPSFLVFNSARV